MKDAKKRAEAGHLRQPGMMRCIDGTLYDLTDLHPGDFDLYNIAWGLGRTLRYAGHIREDYTVAHHSVVMSYIVPEEYALEALFHDAAESLTGDIIYPVKAMFPELSEFEDGLNHSIMRQFEVKTAKHIQLDDGMFLYQKSDPVQEADIKLMEHECFSMGRPGVFHPEIERQWLRAATEHEQWWYAAQYAFLERYDQLTGSHMLDLEETNKRWFPDYKNTDGSLTKDPLSKFMDELLKALPDDSNNTLRAVDDTLDAEFWERKNDD